MISSMTGYGRGEAAEGGITALAEVRSVNSRFLEVVSRLPRTLSQRENDIKELVRTKITRGKVNVSITVVHQNENEVPLRVNVVAAKAYHKLLQELVNAVKLNEQVTLEHLLKFPEVMETEELESTDEHEWKAAQRALLQAVNSASAMRQQEGRELMNDLVARIGVVESILGEVERMAAERVAEERTRLETRLKELLDNRSVIDTNRLEFELVMFADKVDVTEECVRFHSHNKFFLEALNDGDAAGRKLTFLIQEMNREANTLGSKANSSDMAHRVVAIKEELEKIREQLQNIE
jgi:uncharacterized protein (TIGR00255 family)